MRIFFLGDIVGRSGRLAVVANLKDILEKKKIDFVIVNGENASDQGVGITETISNVSESLITTVAPSFPAI